MPSYILLYFQPGSQAWSQFPVIGQNQTIGSASENHLVLASPGVEPRHAVITQDERGVWLIDQRSHDGVFLGGQRLPAGEWRLLPLNVDILIGKVYLRLQLVPDAAARPPAARAAVEQPAVGQAPLAQPQPYPPAAYPPASQPPPAQPAHPAGRAVYAAPRPVDPVPSAPRAQRAPLLLILVLFLGVCLVLGAGGLAAWTYLPGLLAAFQTSGGPQQTGPSGATTAGQELVSPTAKPVSAPPTVIDSLSASAGSGPLKDDRGVTLEVPADALQSGEQVSLERASLSPGMQQDIEKAFQVDSLAYAVRLPDGQDAAGYVDLALPAKTPGSKLAVLVDDRWLGILETQPQDGYFHIASKPAQASATQTYPQPEDTPVSAANRYLVLTPKTGSAAPSQDQIVPASYAAQDEDGKSCISEFWTVNHCWRNPEGSVYAFWEDDYPASLKDTEILRVVDSIKAMAQIMSAYQQKGFLGAAISSSRPLYLIVEAGAGEPYYSNKTGNIYIPWDIIGSIGDSGNRCTLAHELFHWTEAHKYWMNAAAISGPKSWWLEMSAENGSFLLDSSCIEKNLTQYGLVNTSESVLGFQASPFYWESNEQARYIQALQMYLSICDGGAGCALSEQAWIAAINSGSYPMEGGARNAYELNAKDLGRFLLGAAPQQSRAGAFIPPAAVNGTRYGDYLALRSNPRGAWDYGLTMNQFKAEKEKVTVEAKIAKGSVYPLWVSNGTETPMGSSQLGLPGMLEIEAGPAFWIKRDGADPEFHEGGKVLKLGPISNKLGTGKARIVAVAPGGDQTFKATLSVVDLAGDWSTTFGQMTVTPVDCPGYESDSDQENKSDTILQLFTAGGSYEKTSSSDKEIVYTWKGTLEEGVTGESEVKIEPDKVTLHYKLIVPKPADSSAQLLPPWVGSISAPGTRAASPWTWLVVPGTGAAIWLPLRRGKDRMFAAGRVVLASLLVLSTLWLSGCISIYGTIETTYTFNQLEFVDPEQAALSGSGDASSETSQVNWKLSDGTVKFNFDLYMETEDEEGTTKTERCLLTATSSSTATIGPEGSVAPPE